jgi:hypothetical protein
MTKSMSYIFHEVRLNVRGSNPTLNKKIEKNPGFFLFSSALIGPYMLELTITLSHSRLRSPAFRLNYEGKGVGRERSLLLAGHICICG